MGSMGHLYADALIQNPNIDFIACVSISQKNLNNAIDKYYCRGYKSFYEMFRKEKLDAVLITLPDHLHKEAVIAAAEAGVHLLVEKPFATDLKDADIMVQAVQKSGIKCMVEFFNRWSPPFTNAKYLVDQGKLGDIIQFNIELNDTCYVPQKMLKWATASSPAWFLMSHSYDLIWWILGKRPKSVFGRGSKRILRAMGINTYDLIEVLVSYENGTIGRFSSNWVLPEGFPILYELKMRLVGTNAMVDVDTSDQELHFTDQNCTQHPVTAWGKILGSYSGHPFAMLNAFLQNLNEEIPPPVNEIDGWENTYFLDAVHRSVETGREVQLPEKS